MSDDPRLPVIVEWLDWTNDETRLAMGNGQSGTRSIQPQFSASVLLSNAGGSIMNAYCPAWKPKEPDNAG